MDSSPVGNETSVPDVDGKNSFARVCARFITKFAGAMENTGNPGFLLWMRRGRRSQRGTLEKAGSFSGLASGVKRRGEKIQRLRGGDSSEGVEGLQECGAEK